jgi:DNA-binding PadR family transcriptional regulator
MKKAVAKHKAAVAARRLKNGAARDAERAESNEPRHLARLPTRKASLDLALLGLIAEVPGASGYDIMKIFDLSMAHYWHAHPTQIYPTLERMEKLGLIKKRTQVQRRFPTKRLYTITPLGERHLLEWLESPFEGFNLKYASLLRCRFLGRLGPDGAIASLKEERKSWALYLARYRDIESTHFQHGYRDVNAMFSSFTLMRGIQWMEENMRWCNWAIREIKANRSLWSDEALAEIESKRSSNMKPAVGFTLPWAGVTPAP